MKLRETRVPGSRRHSRLFARLFLERLQREDSVTAGPCHNESVARHCPKLLNKPSPPPSHPSFIYNFKKAVWFTGQKLPIPPGDPRRRPRQNKIQRNVSGGESCCNRSEGLGIQIRAGKKKKDWQRTGEGCKNQWKRRKVMSEDASVKGAGPTRHRWSSSRWNKWGNTHGSDSASSREAVNNQQTGRILKSLQSSVWYLLQFFCSQWRQAIVELGTLKWQKKKTQHGGVCFRTAVFPVCQPFFCLTSCIAATWQF